VAWPRVGVVHTIMTSYPFSSSLIAALDSGTWFLRNPPI